MRENIINMIKSVFDSSKEDFKSNFDSEMSDRVAERIADIHQIISKDILKSPNETQEPNPDLE